MVVAMTSKLTAALRRAPATVPALAALALCIVWATDQAGYPVTHWAPGGLIVLALLALALLLVRGPLARASLPVRIALGAFVAYTAFSYLSILWAAVPGEAWEGADRTLLYLMVFALFACWPQRGETAAALLLVWTLSIAGLGLFTLLHLHSQTASALQALLPGGRLDYPSGYPNANAAEWLMAFWPALLLARERRLGWALRGLLAGSAVLLAEVALLSQSRGSLYSMPVMAVLVLALLPGRTRTFAALVPVAIGVAVGARSVLHVGDHLRNGEVVAGTLHHAIALTLLVSGLVAVVFAAGAAIESRRSLSGQAARNVHRGTAAVALAALVAVLAVGLAAAGNPVSRVEKAWHSFKGGYTTEGGGDRLISGLGSNRYDFYRVALDEFTTHPLAGIGVDNFQQQYLRRGHSEETPRYPHSVELRTLVETGLIGTVLALIGFGAALLGAARGIRGPDRLGAAVAAAALAGFGYWVVHGSVDWFWEFAGLGAPAFAMLGLACSLEPSRERKEARAQAGEPAAASSGASANGPPVADGSAARHQSRRGPRVGVLAVGAVLAVAAALSLAAPWLSQLEVQDAARIWPHAPGKAYSRLRQAAHLNPLSDEAWLVTGSIALRFGELQHAEEAFASALRRVPNDAYATLERGAIASTRGRRAQALYYLERATRLNPRDGLTQEALREVRQGKRVSVEELNLAILQKAEQLA
jgi:O-Antigen ligase